MKAEDNPYNLNKVEGDTIRKLIEEHPSKTQDYYANVLGVAKCTLINMLKRHKIKLVRGSQGTLLTEEQMISYLKSQGYDIKSTRIPVANNKKEQTVNLSLNKRPNISFHENKIREDVLKAIFNLNVGETIDYPVPNTEEQIEFRKKAYEWFKYCSLQQNIPFKIKTNTKKQGVVTITRTY